MLFSHFYLVINDAVMYTVCVRGHAVIEGKELLRQGRSLLLTVAGRSDCLEWHVLKKVLKVHVLPLPLFQDIVRICTDKVHVH